MAYVTFVYTDCLDKNIQQNIQTSPNRRRHRGGVKRTNWVLRGFIINHFAIFSQVINTGISNECTTYNVVAQCLNFISLQNSPQLRHVAHCVFTR